MERPPPDEQLLAASGQYPQLDADPAQRWLRDTIRAATR